MRVDCPQELSGGVAIEAHCALLAESFARLLGRPLIDGNPKPSAAQLWTAECGLLSHSVEADPLFNYANKLALELFERDFDSMSGLPSRLSSEAPVDHERIRLLDEVARRGFIENYCGVRISSRGRRFEIRGATVWNLIDGAGSYRGQAAKITQWRYL